MLSTGAAFAYSRDPSAIFQAPECGFPPPLNFESVLSDGVQPVRYCKKRLLQSLDGFKNQDEIVEVIDIDWIKGNITAFYNMEEALNGIPAFSMDNFRIPCEPEPVCEYVKEVMAFLRRGHSFLHPSCTCDHGLSKTRCLTLGISSVCSDFNRRRYEIPCALSRRPREFTAKEVSDELGISDIILFKGNTTSHLIYILKQYCTLRTDGLQLFFSSNEYVLNPMNNREDLMQVLSNNPLTISIGREQYPGILADVQDLVRQDLVHAVELEKADSVTDGNRKQNRNSTGSILLFYMNPRWNIGSVDSDIKEMWHAIKGKDVSMALLAETENRSHYYPINEKKMGQSKKTKKSRSAISARKRPKIQKNLTR